MPRLAPWRTKNVPRVIRKRRDPGPHHQVAVDEPDGQREDQRQQRADPQVEPEVVADHRVDQAGRGDDDAGGQVELAADHQHAHRHGDDADRRGLVEHGEERLGRPERRRDDQEEDEDDDRSDERAHLGAGQQSIGQAEGDSVGRLGRCADGRSLDGLTHGGLRFVAVPRWAADQKSATSPGMRTSGCCSSRTEGWRRCSSCRRRTDRSGWPCCRRCRCRSSWPGRARSRPGSPGRTAAGRPRTGSCRP